MLLKAFVTAVVVATLVCPSASGDRVWETLHIVVVAPMSLLQQLPQAARDGLRLAIGDMRTLVQVRKFANNNVVSQGTILRCTPNWPNVEFAYAVDFESGQLSEVHIRHNITLPFNNANFLVFLQDTSEQCAKDAGLLAAAAPCELIDDQRPISAKLNVCPHNEAWTSFTAVHDLFKHEFLHALGFGLINPDLEGHSPKPQKTVWKLDGKQQSFRSYYMDFQDAAAVHAQRHLACKRLRGVEAEDVDKTHLSEYIYGDELMTPVLSNKRNYFTKISASILESTKRGDRVWYKTNATIVDEETQKYWYGRGWGCTFAEHSCLEYINEATKQRKATVFPFCSYKMLLEMAKGAFYRTNRMPLSNMVCFSNETATLVVRLSCNAIDKARAHQARTAKHFKASTLSEHFNSLRGTKLSALYGSPSPYRFCPFTQEVIFDRIDEVPLNAAVVDCKELKT